MVLNLRPELLNKEIVYCMRADCPRSASCLRYLAYQHSAPFSSASFVDPRNQPTEQGCRHYVSNEVQRMARGFKSAMRLVAHGRIAYFRNRISSELRCGRSHYYRYASGECALTREQQQAVTKVFAEFGIERQEALFDRYEESYEIPY